MLPNEQTDQTDVKKTRRMKNKIINQLKGVALFLSVSHLVKFNVVLKKVYSRNNWGNSIISWWNRTFFVAHWHIVKVKAGKCSTIANSKKIYFQCKKHMHKVSCPCVTTAHELFNKMLVHNSIYIIRPKNRCHKHQTGTFGTKKQHIFEFIIFGFYQNENE